MANECNNDMALNIPNDMAQNMLRSVGHRMQQWTATQEHKAHCKNQTHELSNVCVSNDCKRLVSEAAE